MIVFLYVFLALIIMISVHELAHMITALLCKIKVEAVSLGFGKILLHKKIEGIDFRLSLIPLGGYTKLYGEEDKRLNGFLASSYRKKVAISIAGILANLLLAGFVYFVHYGSIRFGLMVDWLLIKFIFMKDFNAVMLVLDTVEPNFFLLQLGLLNLTSGLFNLLPMPPLDGGLISLFSLEKIFKKNFLNIYHKFCKYGFVFLVLIQIVFLCYIWS